MGRATGLLVTALVVLVIEEAESHGMLVKPPNRLSAWRYGFPTPVNYDDEEQFCGGLSVQWSQHGGRCGLCGDDYGLPTPRPAENGGEYGTGTIVATYKSGQNLRATATLTTNHLGGFSFHLCPLSKPGEPESEACFSKYPLERVEGGTYYPLPNGDKGQFTVDLQLPAGLTCKQCVLRWTYTAGNNWGICPNGTGTMGCGPQETYKNCADITIV